MKYYVIRDDLVCDACGQYGEIILIYTNKEKALKRIEEIKEMLPKSRISEDDFDRETKEQRQIRIKELCKDKDWITDKAFTLFTGLYNNHNFIIEELEMKEEESHD